MRETSFIEIDLSAVTHNVRVLRRIVGPDVALCPVIKADGYGLGAVRLAKTLVHAGAAMLAVYTPDQAADLFRAAVGGPVLVLMPLREIGRADDLYRSMICDRLHLSVHDALHLEDLIEITERYGLVIPVHLEVDTGMSRGGCNLAEAPEALKRIAAQPRLRLAGIYTHFATADSDPELLRGQDDAFEALLTEHAALIPSDCLIHAANSCATLRDRRYHKSMVRIGQAWTGYGSESIAADDFLVEAEHLQPSVTWISQIVQLKTIEAGVSVGYGATWTARRKSLIGLVPVGYADGYPLDLGASTQRRRRAKVGVLVQTDDGPVLAFAPVVGAVSMDQITVDLTQLGGRGATLSRCVQVGDRVELISADPEAPNHLTALAELAGSITYELLCGLSPRIRRRYREAPAEVKIVGRPSPAAVAG